MTVPLLDARVGSGDGGAVQPDTVGGLQGADIGLEEVRAHGIGQPPGDALDHRHRLVGGQVGIADHIVIGDGVKIAAKSGVIGDVASGTTIAGYPAVERPRWLRGLAELYRLSGGSTRPPTAGTIRPPGES